QFLQILEYDGLAVRLAQQAAHLRVAVLAVNEELFAAVEAGLDAVLQLEYHRAARVNQRQQLARSGGEGWQVNKKTREM
nr:hypothetical protein [Tanacetum cinerariifolium]